MGTALITVVERGIVGNRRSFSGTGTLSSSYALNGDTAGLALFGLNHVADQIDILPSGGYEFQWDKTNNKIIARRPRAANSYVITEESLTVSATAYTTTLASNPAYIIAIDVTAGGTTGPFNAIPTGETPLTTEVAVTFTSGLLTFLSTDAVTAARVTYIPQIAGTPFATANLVIDEAVVAAAAKQAFANRALAVQYVYDNTDSVRVALEPVGEAPSATHTGVIDIDNGSDATDIDSHSDDEGNSLKITYLKYSTLDGTVRAIGDADITLTGTDPEQYNFTSEGGYSGLVVPGMGTQLVGEATATNLELIWSGPSATTGAAVPTWHPTLNVIRTQESTAVTTTAIPYFMINPLFHANIMAEVTPATDLSGTTFQWRAIGA